MQQQRRRQCPILTCHGDNGAVGASFSLTPRFSHEPTHSEINTRHLLPRRVSNICSLRPEERTPCLLCQPVLPFRLDLITPSSSPPPPQPLSCHVWELSNQGGGGFKRQTTFLLLFLFFFFYCCVCGGVSKTRMRRRRGGEKKKSSGGKLG